MQDPMLICFEAATAGSWWTSFSSLGGDLSFNLIFFSVLLSDWIGCTFSYVNDDLLLNLKKLGVTFLCFTFYCTNCISLYIIKYYWSLIVNSSISKIQSNIFLRSLLERQFNLFVKTCGERRLKIKLAY